MKHAAWLVLALSSCLYAQQGPTDGSCDAASAPPASRGSSVLSRTGIAWNRGLDAVLHRDRPILLFQLLGRFDEGDC